MGAASAATERPAAVDGPTVKAGSITTDGATFTRDEAAWAASYRLVIVNASTPGAGAAYNSGYTLHGTSVTVSKLAAGTAYEARIDAENGGGDGDWSPWVMLYTTTLESDAGAATPFSVPTGGSFKLYATLLAKTVTWLPAPTC